MLPGEVRGGGTKDGAVLLSESEDTGCGGQGSGHLRCGGEARGATCSGYSR